MADMFMQKKREKTQEQQMRMVEVFEYLNTTKTMSDSFFSSHIYTVCA